MTFHSEINAITFPDGAQVRSRKVVTRSRARSTGKYPSWKMGRMIEWESVNELNAFRLLDCDAKVVRFTEQPCQIEYVLNGEPAKHFPDILVELNGQKELWEVKPNSVAFQPEIKARTEFLTRRLPEWGYAYRVVLDCDLSKQPLLKNAQQLLHFGRRPVNACEQEFMRLVVNQDGALLWSEACSGAYGEKGRQVICRLVLKGVLRWDMTSPWTQDTKFFPVEGAI